MNVECRAKIPKIADVDIVDEVAPLRIDRGDARLAIKHVDPFGLLAPMQFTHAAAIQPRFRRETESKIVGEILDIAYPPGTHGAKRAVCTRALFGAKTGKRLVNENL